MKCRERLEQYLRENDVPYEVRTHTRRYTMQEVAAELHVSGKQVAKVILVKAGRDMAMFVVPASHRLDLAKVRTLLSTEDVRLAEEGEFAGLFPDCSPGAMPPLGHLYDVPVYIDRALAEQDKVVFRVGTHREVMQIAYADLERLAQPMVGEFAYLV